MTEEFKVGDIVEGTHPSRYGTTKIGWRGNIVKMCGDRFDVRGIGDDADPHTFRDLECKYFKKVEEGFTLLKAFDTSIKRWEFYSKRNYADGMNSSKDLVLHLPELRDYKSHCGLCEYYRKKDTDGMMVCGECPLRDGDGKTCYNSEHVFDTWQQDRTPKNAQVVLDLIIQKKKAVLGMTEEFKVGDIVEVVKKEEGYGGPEVGNEGVVAHISVGEPNIGVDFSKSGWNKGHNCDGTTGKSGYYMFTDRIKKLSVATVDKVLTALGESIEHWEDNILQLKRWDRAGKDIMNANMSAFSVGGDSVSYHGSACALCRISKGCYGCPLETYGYWCNDSDSTWRGIKESSGNMEIISNCEKMLNTLLEVRVKYLADKTKKKEKERKEREGEERKEKERQKYTLDEDDEEADLVFKLELSPSKKRVLLMAKKPNEISWDYIVDVTPEGELYRNGDINEELGLKLDDENRIVEGKSRL